MFAESAIMRAMDSAERYQKWFADGVRIRGMKKRVAETTTLDATAISKIISGKRKIKAHELPMLAKAIGRRPPVVDDGGHIASEDVMDDEYPDLDMSRAVSTVEDYTPTLPNGSPAVSSALSAGGGSVPQSGAYTKGGITYSADAILGEIVLPPPVSASISNAPTSRIHWFEVRGDSMEPTLTGGDWVGVNTTDLAIGQGGVFALRDGNGEILVKRLRRLRGENEAKVEIISDNPRQGVDIEYIENITVFGRIVARIARVG